ncbi:MAG: NAD(P)/FAD-dependent oxidoreductase [Gammaproteobacteria bacterium]|nr:NAD(P)/FAD-dependent oxidoreductase [Gammaproteobacteria bacterium]
MELFDVIIIGAGASGLMCAITAAQRGRKVLVIERSNKIGKKILMSGGGRCNFTNYTVEAGHYICRNPHFVKSALSQYTQWDFISLVASHGIAFHERDHGQLFCDDSAKDILNLLKSECDQAGVEIRLRCEVEKISHDKSAHGKFYLKTKTAELSCDSLVIATGGLSIPTLGSSAYGYQVARQFGLDVFDVRAGLVPFTFSDWFKVVAENNSGTAVKVTMQSNGHSFTENMLFTHRGLSGPVVLQISNYWQQGDAISINLLPDLDVRQLLFKKKQSAPAALLKKILSTHLPAKLVADLGLKFWPAVAEKAVAEIADAVLIEVADAVSALRLKPSGTEGYRTAEVTLSGVNTDEVSSQSMQSKRQPGLYFVGEVLDVTGHLGGYNFQWAWSSGYVAGRSV